MVFKEIFQTPCQDGNVLPDPAKTRRRVKDKGICERTISNGLAILQTCQQVHDEATITLYGISVFYFDDTQHDSRIWKVQAVDRYCAATTPSVNYAR